MIQTLLEEVSDVNGIADAIRERFSFIKVGLVSERVQGSRNLVSGRGELLYEGNSIAKW